MKSEVLSSDILEQQFGPTELVVFQQGPEMRLIGTRVAATGQLLELSRVKFVQAGAEAFAKVHKAVLAGASMGKAFRQAGVPFVREQRAAFHYELPPTLHPQFNEEGAATIVAVSVLAGEDQVPYADILEIYHPHVAWPTLEGEPTRQQLDEIQALAELASGNSSLAKDI